MKKELGIATLLVVLCVVVGLKNPHFLTAVNLRHVGFFIGMYGIYSIGMGIIIITGGIDLSVGSVFALQGVLLSIMLAERHWSWPIAVLCAIAGVVALGIFHGFLITKIRLQPFIVTLCGFLIYRGLARFIAGDKMMGFGDTDQYGVLEFAAAGYWHRIPMPLILMLAIAIIMFFVLHRSVYGRYLFAVGRNEDAARFSGINTQRVIGSAYALSMLLTGITGIILAFYSLDIAPSTHGQNFELYGIAAAVLGGCSLRGGEGSILGILLGTALIQVLPNFVILLGIDPSLNLAVIGVVILLAVLLDEILSWRKRRAGRINPARGFPVITEAKLASPSESAKSL
jgi:ribose transport system permease protein